MTTNPNLDLAREWAQLVGPGAASNIGRAAAEVITSLPDEWIDADKLREVIEGWRTTTNQTMHRVDKTYKSAAADIEALLPTPQPRTLADTKWDDNVHPYMEAVTVSGRRHILLAPMGDTAVSENTILVAEHDGGMPVLVPAEDLSPTGRYARLSLPEDQATNHYTTQEKK